MLPEYEGEYTLISDQERGKWPKAEINKKETKAKSHRKR